MHSLVSFICYRCNKITIAEIFYYIVFLIPLEADLKTTISIIKPNTKLIFPQIFMLILNVMTHKYALTSASSATKQKEKRFSLYTIFVQEIKFKFFC